MEAGFCPTRHFFIFLSQIFLSDSGLADSRFRTLIAIDSANSDWIVFLHSEA